MPRVATGALALPSTNTPQALIRAGKHEAAIAQLHERVRKHPDDHAAWHQLALACSQRRDFFGALRAIKKALRLAPDALPCQRLQGVTLANMGDCEAAIACLLPLAQARGDDRIVLQALQVAYYKAGKPINAIALGRRILQLEDREASVQPVADTFVQPGPVVSAQRRVIAYSLWGAQPAYNYGAMINARLAKYIYPGWRCRFYLGAGVPDKTRHILKQSGAEIIEAATQHAQVAPSMWRFLAADDPGVAIFLCRDCDARLSPKEAAAVDVWLRSGKRAHVMRDHVLHRNLLLAGMWGARTDKPLFMAARMQRFSTGATDARYGADQRFLACEIWPEVRGESLIHDSYYDLFGAQPFPIIGKGNDRAHVGMGIVGADALRREAAAMGLPWPLV